MAYNPGPLKWTIIGGGIFILYVLWAMTHYRGY